MPPISAKQKAKIVRRFSFTWQRFGLFSLDVNELGTDQTSYSFRDVFEALASARSFEEVLDVILATSLRELNADQGSLLLLHGGDENAGHLKMLAARGLPEEIVKRGYVPRSGSISEYVLRERRPLILNDAPRTRDYESMQDETSTPRSLRSALCVPLIARGSVIGTMNLNRSVGDKPQFSDHEMEICSMLAGQAAIVIENRRLQDELLRSERLAAIGQTVAGISHCIKNILAGVKGGIGITQMGMDQNDRDLLQQGFDLLKRSTGTLSNLVLDLLDYSKEREPMRDSFDVCRTIEDVAGTLRFKAEQANVVLSTNTPDTEITYYGDADQVMRALLNLVTNAIEATGEFREQTGNGQVDVSARIIPAQLASQYNLSANGDWVEITVEDNGPGIADEVQDQIWDLFYSTKGSRGTGIGLAATRKMIEEHGGAVKLKSVLNEGTIFQVLLPCHAAQSAR